MLEEIRSGSRKRVVLWTQEEKDRDRVCLEAGAEADHPEEHETNQKPVKRQRKNCERPPPRPVLQQPEPEKTDEVVVVASRQPNKISFASIDIREKQKKEKKTQSQEPGTSGRLPGTRKLGESFLQSQKACMTSWLSGSPGSPRARPETQKMSSTTVQTSSSKDNQGLQMAAPPLATSQSSTGDDGPKNEGGGSCGCNTASQ